MEFWRNMPESLPEDRTLWVGNLSDEVTEDILWELFLQAGPLKRISMPRDDQGMMKRFAFVEFTHELSVPYALELMQGVKLYNRPLRCQFRPTSCHSQGEKPVLENYLCGQELPDVFKGLQRQERERIVQRTLSCPTNNVSQGIPTQLPAHHNQYQQPQLQQYMTQYTPVYNQPVAAAPQFGNAFFTNPATGGEQLLNFLRQGMAMNANQQYGYPYQGYNQNYRR